MYIYLIIIFFFLENLVYRGRVTAGGVVYDGFYTVIILRLGERDEEEAEKEEETY